MFNTMLPVQILLFVPYVLADQAVFAGAEVADKVREPPPSRAPAGRTASGPQACGGHWAAVVALGPGDLF